MSVGAFGGEDHGGLNQDSKASNVAHTERMAPSLGQVQDPPMHTSRR